MNPAPHTPHLDNPENKYWGRLAKPILPVRVMVRRVALWRCFAAFHSSSLSIRRDGISLVIHSDYRANRHTHAADAGFSAHYGGVTSDARQLWHVDRLL